MKLSSLPARIAAIFAASAQPSAKNTIPLTAAGTTQPGQASFDVGFPAVTMQPAASGGINPYGQDFNGIINAITAVQQWQSAGGSFPFDADFAATVGGYPLGAVIVRADGMGFWLCLADNNTTNPDSAGAANWAPLDAYGITPITGLTTGTVTLTPAQYGLPILTLAGTLTGNVQLIFPAVKSQWQVVNNTTGNFSITCKTAAGTGVIVQQGGAANVYGDGTNIVLPAALQVGSATQSQQAIPLGQADGRYPRVYSITALPAQNVGPIAVAEVGEIWVWSASQYFTGYRSPLCGRAVHGHTLVPLANEVDAVGGTLSKTAYAALWGYAQENGLVVASAAWVTGMHMFVDLGGGNFRCPDLRNMFPRFTGTDTDTGNARTLGSAQNDTMQGHAHGANYLGTGARGDTGYLVDNTPSGGTSNKMVLGPVSDGTNGTPRTGKETRPVNTAYAPRIHV